MKHEHTLDSSLFYSKAKYSPFDGMHAKGKPVKTFVNGKLVMDEGQLINEYPNGSIIQNTFSQDA
jgi:dihydroorotase